MYHVRNKVLAGVIALCTVAATAAPMSASAATPSIVPNSKFSFDLRTEIIDDNELAVTFYSTYNPGVTEIAVALQYDPEKCTFLKRVPDLEFGSLVASGGAVNTETGVCTYAAAVIADSTTAVQYDYTGSIAITYYFQVNGSLTEDDYDFKSCVYSYKSQAENIAVSHNPPSLDNADVSLKVDGEESVSYVIGDVNNDQVINITDASDVFGLINQYRAYDQWGIDPDNKVDNINHLINIDKVISNNSGTVVTWGNKFSYLIRDGIACCEAADATQDGNIQQDDAEAILQYYSTAGSNQTIENLAVGKGGVKFKMIETTV